MRGRVIFFVLLFIFFSFQCFAQSQAENRLRNIELRLERVETMLKEFKESVDKRFEQIDKRFEQVDKRFEQMSTFLWIITGIFTAIMVANIGFAYWDRKTIIRKAKEETMAEIEKEGRLKDLIYALRELSKTNSDVANILRQFNLL